MNRVQILSIVVTLALMFITFELVRKRRISERYAVLWFGAELVLLVFAVFENVLFLVAGLVGIFYPPAVLIPILMFFVIALSLHFSVVVSRLSKENKKLAQEISFLKSRLDRQLSPADTHEQTQSENPETTNLPYQNG